MEQNKAERAQRGAGKKVGLVSVKEKCSSSRVGVFSIPES